MLVKIGDKQFDSARVPIAFVISPQEKQIFYNLIQAHIVARRGIEMAFCLGPDDIPHEIVSDWLEKVTGKSTAATYSEGGSK